MKYYIFNFSLLMQLVVKHRDHKLGLLFRGWKNIKTENLNIRRSIQCSGNWTENSLFLPSVSPIWTSLALLFWFNDIASPPKYVGNCKIDQKIVILLLLSRLSLNPWCSRYNLLKSPKRCCCYLGSRLCRGRGRRRPRWRRCRRWGRARTDTRPRQTRTRIGLDPFIVSQTLY